jgi:hypothetical protein
MNGPFFENGMDHLEKEAWQNFRNLMDNFLEKAGFHVTRILCRICWSTLKSWDAT